MVVGSPPFMAENEMKMVELIRTRELRIPTDSLMDPHLKNLLFRMLTKTPEGRISLKEVRLRVPCFPAGMLISLLSLSRPVCRSWSTRGSPTRARTLSCSACSTSACG